MDDDPYVLDPDHAPTPYTADEIRLATPQGLEITTVTDTVDGVVTHLTTFVRCGPDDADIESVALDHHGTPSGEVRRGTARWLDLQAHASFPAAITTRSDETIDHPLGPLACRRYEVDREHGTAVFWFARDIAGMPVRHGVLVDGALREVTEMVARRVPDPP